MNRKADFFLQNESIRIDLFNMNRWIDSNRKSEYTTQCQYIRFKPIGVLRCCYNYWKFNYSSSTDTITKYNNTVHKRSNIIYSPLLVIFPRYAVKAVSAMAKTHGCQKLLSPFSSGRRYGVSRKRTVITEVFRRYVLSALEALCDYALYKSTFTLHLHYVEQQLSTKYIFCKLTSIFLAIFT